MSASNTEIVGFLDQLVRLMEDNHDDLKVKGLEVSPWIAEVTDLKNDIVTKSIEQDGMQAALKAKTKDVQAATKLGYDTGSTRLDAIVGVLGKTTPLGKQSAKLRSNIIKQSKKKTDDNKPK